MAKNRTRPYGYKIEGGKPTIEQSEAEVIRRIYRRYADGLSYKSIAEALSAEGLRYMPDKPTWNKNMVARILQNETYLGTDKYPAIVNHVEHRLAQEAFKPYNHTERTDIKALKPLLVCGICGEPIRRRLKSDGQERWYCPSDTGHIGTVLRDESLLESIKTLQGYLVSKPELARAEKTAENHIDLDIIRCQNEIADALARTEIDATALQESIKALAVRRYALCTDATGDSEEIITRLTRASGTELNSQLLREITVQIKIVHIKAMALVLRNGIAIQSPTSEKGVKTDE